MSLLEQQNFTARLFVDDSLRRDFLLEPEKIGLAHNLSENEIGQIKSIAATEITWFADSLFYKRLHEVEKFLPLTRKLLQKDFQNQFREFTKSFHPKTIKKHLEDAVEFAGFLSKQSFEKGWINDLAIYEQARLSFNGYHKPLIIKSFSYDPREFKNENPRKKRTFAVWLRIGKFTKHYIF